MKRSHLAGAVMALALAMSPGTAAAGILTGTFGFSVWTGETNGTGFQAVQGATIGGSPASATFNYFGGLNFDLNQAQNSTNAGDLNSAFFATATNAGAAGNYGISNYLGSGTFTNLGSGCGTPPCPVADYGTLAGFLASSASASGYNWGSLYRINLGVLNAGSVLTVTHDDGFSIFQNGQRIGNTTAGPTSRITETVTLTNTAETFLYYGRQNGSPSVLKVDAQLVPDGGLTLSLFALGCTGLGFARRRFRS